MLFKFDNDSYTGDEIDLKMFERTKARMLNSSNPGVFREIELNSNRFEILRVNQF